MFEKIKERLDWNRANMVAFLYTNKVSYECEEVEWFTVGNENDYYEIDIWLDNVFIQIYYNQYGEMNHYEIEEDCY